MLGRLWDGIWDGVKFKKLNVCRPWDGGTAYTGGGGVCPLRLSTQDTKLPSSWTGNSLLLPSRAVAPSEGGSHSYSRSLSSSQVRPSQAVPSRPKEEDEYPHSKP